jgi:hypothetical protein
LFLLYRKRPLRVVAATEERRCLLLEEGSLLLPAVFLRLLLESALLVSLSRRRWSGTLGVAGGRLDSARWKIRNRVSNLVTDIFT